LADTLSVHIILDRGRQSEQFSLEITREILGWEPMVMHIAILTT